MKINDVLITEGWQDGMKHFANAWKLISGGDDSEAEIDRLTQASGRAFQDQWVRLVANLRHTYKDKEDQGLGEAAKQLAAMFMKIGVPMLAPGTTGNADLMVKRAWTGQDYATGQPKSTPALYAGNKTVKQLFDTIIAETKAGRERGSAVAQAFDYAADQALSELQRKQNDPYASQDTSTSAAPKDKSPRESIEKYFGKALANTPYAGLVDPNSDEYENAVIPVCLVRIRFHPKPGRGRGQLAIIPDGMPGAGDLTTAERLYPQPQLRTFILYNGEWREDDNPDTDEYSLVTDSADSLLKNTLDNILSKVSLATGGQSVNDVPPNVEYAYGSRQLFMRRKGTSATEYSQVPMTAGYREMFK
jgi:hypothetical protein